MIGLTAWISAMVGAMGVWFTSVMPLLLLALCGPLAMLNFLHYIWAKLNGLWNPSRDKWVQVYDISTYPWTYAMHIDDWHRAFNDMMNHKNSYEVRERERLRESWTDDAWQWFVDAEDDLMSKSEKYMYNLDKNDKTWWNVHWVYERTKWNHVVYYNDDDE